MTGSALRYLTVFLIAILCAECRSDDVASAPVTCLAVTQDGQYVLDGSQHGVHVRDWESLAVERTLQLSFRQLHDMRLSPDESKLVVAGGNPAEEAAVEMYSWPDLKLLWKQTFSEDVVYCAAFDPATDRLAVAGHDHLVYLMEAAAGTIVCRLDGHSKPVTGVVFLPGGRSLLSCSVDHTIRVWDSGENTIIRSLNNHTQAVNQLAFVGSAQQTLPLVASVSDDRTVRFWQPTIGRMVRFKRLHSDVAAVAGVENSQRVIVGTRDGRLLEVDVQTLQTKDLLPQHVGWIYSIVIHPSGCSVLAGTSDGLLHKAEFSE